MIRSFWFFALIVAVPLFVILWRRRPRGLEAPSFVRIVNPLPGEEGRHLLIWSDPERDEYRVGLRGSEGSVRSYGRAELEEWPE